MLGRVIHPGEGERAGDRTVVVLPGGVKMAFRWCPAGEFVTGSPEYEKGRIESEGPQRMVCFESGFWMGETPVTQEQWLSVMEENPSPFVANDRPVECVTWHEAQACINHLRQRGIPVRLPSESQWEYACRAGSTTRFSFGDDENRLHDYAWYKKNSGGSTHPVGKKKANNWGLRDMHGNVWEWCADVWHYSYEGAPTDGSALVLGGDQQSRVLRSGSRDDAPQFCRSAFRYWNSAYHRSGNFGFRLVLDSF